MSTFEHEVEFELPASAMCAALKDQGKILPKVMPEFVSSVETVEGDGVSVGTVTLVKFGPAVPHVAGFVKEKLVALDPESYSAVSEEVEGGHLAQFGFTKYAQSMKLISTGENTSKLHITTEIEGGSEEAIAKSMEATKPGLTHAFKAVEAYKKANA